MEALSELFFLPQLIKLTTVGFFFICNLHFTCLTAIFVVVIHLLYYHSGNSYIQFTAIVATAYFKHNFYGYNYEIVCKRIPQYPLNLLPRYFDICRVEFTVRITILLMCITCRRLIVIIIIINGNGTTRA